MLSCPIPGYVVEFLRKNANHTGNFYSLRGKKSYLFSQKRTNGTRNWPV